MAQERTGHTLNPTALVHEAWLRIQKSAPGKWRDRKQFYAAASETMRRILIEAARRSGCSPHGNRPLPLLNPFALFRYNKSSWPGQR